MGEDFKLQEIENEIDLTQFEYYMQECFELARNGLGRTSPNPVVGAIVLDKNGIPLGKGFHRKAGQEHAEVLALNEAGKLANGGTLIVNLEPCCYLGKTPPCTEIIIKSNIAQVVFSNYDQNPQVYKKGEGELIKHNIKVVTGVLEIEGHELNKFFFKWIKTKLPWITLKQSQTLDGKIALRNKQSRWITSDLARNEVHKLRNIYDAILVGASTVQIDNPKLTTRDIEGGRNPVRIVIDSNLITDVNSNVYKENADVILVTKSGQSKDKINSYLKVGKRLNVLEIEENRKGKLDLKNLFTHLGKKEILSVLVEAGPTLGSELVLNNLIDEYVLFISPKLFGDTEAISSISIGGLDDINHAFNFEFFNQKVIGNDLMLSLRPHLQTLRKS